MQWVAMSSIRHSKRVAPSISSSAAPTACAPARCPPPVSEIKKRTRLVIPPQLVCLTILRRFISAARRTMAALRLGSSVRKNPISARDGAS